MQITRAVNKDVIGKMMLPSILINLLSLAVPLTVLQIYDRILPNQSYGTATMLIVGASTAVILEALIRYVRSWLLSAAASNTENTTFAELVTAITQSKPNALRNLGAAGVDNGLSNIVKVREWYSGGIISGFIDLPFALLFLGLVYYIGGSLVLVPIAVWVTACTVVFIVSTKSKRLSDIALEKDQERKGFMLLLGQTIQGIKRQAVESRLYSQFKRANDARYLSKSSEEQQNSFSLEFIKLASLMTSVVIVVIGSLWVLDGVLTTGGLAACSILSGRAVAPLSALIGMRVKLNTIHSANRAIQNIQTLPKQHSESVSSESISSLSIDKLTARRFGVDYHASFDVKQSSIVLISSDERHIDSFFAAVIAGVDESQSGTIFINQQETPLESFHFYTSYVGVKAQLVSGSLLDNLCGFDAGRIERATDYAKKLGLWRKLSQLHDGLETKVGHTAVNTLSMGNTKLLNIAAQLASPASVLVLDRPDASLDLDGLAALAQVLQEEKEQGRIILLVSHNPTLVALASNTVVVSKTGQGASL